MDLVDNVDNPMEPYVDIFATLKQALAVKKGMNANFLNAHFLKANV